MDLTVLDAGVLIAVLSANDAHHAKARVAVAASRERGDLLVVPASAYAEILVGPLRATPPTDTVVDGFLAALPARVEPVTSEIARAAAELRARHGNRLRLPDAVVVATAVRLLATGVITTDAGWPAVAVPVEVVSAD